MRKIAHETNDRMQNDAQQSENTASQPAGQVSSGAEGAGREPFRPSATQVTSNDEVWKQYLDLASRYEELSRMLAKT